MGVKVQDTEILRGVLDQWKAGIDTHEPRKVAAVFAEDAIFQGLRPYSVGRDGVVAYYDSRPPGMYRWASPPGMGIRSQTLLSSGDEPALDHNGNNPARHYPFQRAS